VERSIEQAPEWVRTLQSPAAEIAAMRADVGRYLAGDTCAPVGPVEGLLRQLDAVDDLEAAS
jgi:hypothetical protein